VRRQSIRSGQHECRRHRLRDIEQAEQSTSTSVIEHYHPNCCLIDFTVRR
jgi:hypothetical protein